MNSRLKTKPRDEGVNLLKYLGPVVIAIGLTLFYRGSDMMFTYARSAFWPVVEGTVVSAETFRERYSHNSVTTGSRAVFTYEYEGRPYTGDRIDIVGGSNKNAEDKKRQVSILLAAREAGRTVKVFVNPRNPDYAFLFRELSFDPFGVTGLGIFVTWIGWLMARPLLRRKTAKAC